MFQTNAIGTTKIHGLFFIKFFSENRVIYEIMWQNVVQTDRLTTDSNAIRRMLIACRITKATYTLSTYNTYCFCTVTMVTGTRLNVLFGLTL